MIIKKCQQQAKQILLLTTKSAPSTQKQFINSAYSQVYTYKTNGTTGNLVDTPSRFKSDYDKQFIEKTIKPITKRLVKKRGTESQSDPDTPAFEEFREPRINTSEANSNYNKGNGNQNQIYTSKHYKVQNKDIISFLSQYKVVHRMKGNEIQIMECPFCLKPHKNDPTNLNTLNIESNKGVFYCFRCQARGSWFDFKNRIMERMHGINFNDMVSTGINFDNQDISKNGSASTDYYMNNDYHPSQSSLQDSVASHQNATFDIKLAHKYFLNMTREIYPEINNYLSGTENDQQRHISKETLKVYRVGVGNEKFKNSNDQLAHLPVVYYPLYQPKSRKEKAKKDEEKDSDSLGVQQKREMKLALKEMNTEDFKLVKMKARAIGKDHKHQQRFMPAGSSLKGIFGLTSLKPSDEAIVITEGEYDAMACFQETGIPSVSLPNGANHLPVVMLPFFEKFKRIYLWLDADEVGRASAETFARKLGPNRTVIIDSRLGGTDGPKDANEALQDNYDFKQIFKDGSRQLNDQNLLTFSDIKEKVLQRILNYDTICGVQSQWFNFYNKCMKGLRKGELTLVTGATGSGKTTFLSQLSLDFTTQGVPTLWGSFEIKNEVLAMTMLQQQSQEKLTVVNEKLEDIMNKFEEFPLYFMKFYGSTPIDLLFQTLEYAIYAYDINVICLDNMQFMLSDQADGFHKFDLQDKVTGMLRRLATEQNVHIFLVIHPKKVDDEYALTTGSIFGTAKITQEADSVIILQKEHTPNLRRLELKKNRFDGTVGDVSLAFNKDNKRYFEISNVERQKLQSRQGDLKFLIKERKDQYGSIEIPIEKLREQDELKEGSARPMGSATIKKPVDLVKSKKSIVQQGIDSDFEKYTFGNKQQYEEQNLEESELNRIMYDPFYDEAEHQHLVEEDHIIIDPTHEIYQELSAQSQIEVQKEEKWVAPDYQPQQEKLIEEQDKGQNAKDNLEQTIKGKEDQHLVDKVKQQTQLKTTFFTKKSKSEEKDEKQLTDTDKRNYNYANTRPIKSQKDPEIDMTMEQDRQPTKEQQEQIDQFHKEMSYETQPAAKTKTSYKKHQGQQQRQDASGQSFPYKYTQDEPNQNSPIPEINLNDEEYKRAHEILRPKWITDIEPVTSFYSQQDKTQLDNSDGKNKEEQSDDPIMQNKDMADDLENQIINEQISIEDEKTTKKNKNMVQKALKSFLKGKK